MARGLVSAEGIGAFSYPCINGSSAEIVRGRPLMRKGLHTNEGQVIYGLGGMALGEFAGVLSEDLEYNGVADISSSKLKTHGKIRATVYVDGTPSTYIAGANLLPCVVSGVSCFKRVVRSTGIRLLEDWTAKTASTMYKVEEMGGAKIFVEPGVSIHNGLLHYFWENPAVADADYYLAAQATSNTVITTVLAASMLNSATPDFARNGTITPGGTTADVFGGDYIVYGTDIFGDAISETFTIAANASTIQTGTKCFATIQRAARESAVRNRLRIVASRFAERLGSVVSFSTSFSAFSPANVTVVSSFTSSGSRNCSRSVSGNAN